MLYLCYYIYLRIPVFHTISVSDEAHIVNNSTTVATSGTRTAYSSRPQEFTPKFSWGSCWSFFSIFSSYVQCFVDHDLSLLSYLFWPLYCLSFYFILVTPLVSPSISFDIKQQWNQSIHIILITRQINWCLMSYNMAGLIVF